MTEDKQLILQIRNGDRGAFDRLFRRWYPTLLAYACHYLPREDAEDVVQDVMSSLWTNSGNIVINGETGPYLHAAVRNRCLNCLEHSVVGKRYYSSVRQSVIDAVSIDDQTSVRELSSLLSDALEALPPEQRDAFRKSRSEGLKYNQIAAESKVSVKTVEYRISQALRKLRFALADYLHK